MRASHRSLAAVVTLFVLTAPRTTQAQVSDPLQYRLFPGSELEYGCLGACACPVVFFGPVDGQFTVYRPGLDPTSGHYQLLNIAWSYPAGPASGDPPRIDHVTGNGTYDLSGEGPPSQRMMLDLTINGSVHQQFDSGWVEATVRFPAIDILVKLSVNACMDSAFHLLAAPLSTTAAEPVRAPRLLRSLNENPSASPIEFLLALADPAAVTVDVVDVRGRVVTRLVDGERVAGDRRLRWDGRDARGVDVGAGVFWIRARAGILHEEIRFVRLR